MIALLSSGGCGDVRQIATKLNTVQVTAREIEQTAAGANVKLDEAIGTGEVGPIAKPMVQSAQGDLTTIGESAGTIGATARKAGEHLTGVEDTVSPWVQLAKLWAYVLIIAGALALAIYLGVGPVIRSALAAVGMFIPKPQQAAAKLYREGKADEAMAVLRTQNKTLDAAFRKAKTSEPPLAAPGSHTAPAPGSAPSPLLEIKP